MSERELNCPQCHSDNVQSFDLVYSQNVSQSHHTTVGGGVIGGNLGTGLSVTNGASVTALGQTVAPPQQQSRSIKRSVLLFFSIPFLLCGIFLFLPASVSNIISILYIVGFIFYEYKKRQAIKKWNEEVWPKLYDEWQHSYLCLKCGNRFIIR